VTLSYEQARELAANPAADTRLALAGRNDIPPEILYFLASDPFVAVRRAVASNPLTPGRGNLLLADDLEEEVRQALATKISRIKPQNGKERTLTRQVLDRLTKDRVAQVRAVIAEALKDLCDADTELIGRLARDAEILVSGPVLEYSPLLTDQDLVDVIQANPMEGALSAISRRAYVGEEVTRAIVASGNATAISQLLGKANAQLQESTLDSLIVQRLAEADWQEKATYRPELKEQSSLRLAQAVASQLLERIMARRDLPQENLRAIAFEVRKRLNVEVANLGARLLPSDSLASQYEPLLQAARVKKSKGQLNEAVLMVALLADEVDEVVAGLSVLTDLSVSTILQVVAAQSPRALSALAWAAGLSALFAADLQLRIGHIASTAVIRPRDNGEYRLESEEMQWQVDMFKDFEAGS